MDSPSCLTDPEVPLVVDTSVAINLLATDCAEELVRALPNRLIAVEKVPLELQNGAGKDRGNAMRLDSLVQAGLIHVVELNPDANHVFERLVSGRAADTLDDGEAATIAYARAHHVVAVLDERKATRICSQRFPDLPVITTVDILALPLIERRFGREWLSQATLNALQTARMRVAPRLHSWVIDLVGEANAARCVSLPSSVRERLHEGTRRHLGLR